MPKKTQDTSGKTTKTRKSRASGLPRLPKKPKDPQQPKKLQPYMYWLHKYIKNGMSVYQKLRQKYPDLKAKQISEKAGAVWREIKKESTSEYQDALAKQKAHADKVDALLQTYTPSEEYLKKLEVYQYNHDRLVAKHKEQKAKEKAEKAAAKADRAAKSKAKKSQAA